MLRSSTWNIFRKKQHDLSQYERVPLKYNDFWFGTKFYIVNQWTLLFTGFSHCHTLALIARKQTAHYSYVVNKFSRTAIRELVALCQYLSQPTAIHRHIISQNFSKMRGRCIIDWCLLLPPAFKVSTLNAPLHMNNYFVNCGAIFSNSQMRMYNPQKLWHSITYPCPNKMVQSAHLNCHMQSVWNVTKQKLQLCSNFVSRT